MMGNSGGGLITNSRMKRAESNGLPNVAPMKAAQQPQQAPTQPAPAQAAPPPQQPVQPQPVGMPPGQMEQQPQVNTLANNALALLHDEQAAPEFEKLISQGEIGAAHAVVLIGKQVLAANQQAGAELNPEEMSDAIEAVISDVSEIGIGLGYLPQEPMIDGEPASKLAMTMEALEMWAQEFPEFAQGIQAELQDVTPQDEAAARQLAEYVGGSYGQS